ncbi:hypothetical protein [Litchfieldia alkalitelluris]|uniref:hypothetical protein n=1 Tax=Litchfieldia alkalitelluris TaxID=304268 RepID=UPI000996D8CA|nr:hypothetical protein [Litchfieldia alkalitelluris]
MSKKFTIVILGILILSFVAFIQFSNPLKMDGIFTTTNENGKIDIVFEVSNEGFNRIKLREVTINNNKTPDSLELGISYDTGHLVQSGLDHPLIRFTEIDEKYIFPSLSPQESMKAIERKEMTPIHYGIKVEFHDELMESMTIKYYYFGFPVTKKYSLERWDIINTREN